MIVINQVKTEIKPEKITGSDDGKNIRRIPVKGLIDDENTLKAKAAGLLGISAGEIDSLEIIKHSIDARKKPLLYNVYTLGITLKGRSEEKAVKRCRNNNISVAAKKRYIFPYSCNKEPDKRPVIIGMGPAGLFCGYMLASNGFKPLILDRGNDVETRTKDVESFWKTGELNTESNVQFGEGGAGAFSDGKLNTLINDKDGRSGEILRIFNRYGAPEEILYESKPHIGTDILRGVIANMRRSMIEHGAEVRLACKASSFDIGADGRIKGVLVGDGEYISADSVVLAIGHSARDTFEYLDSLGIPMESKSFAVGMRVEHPQRLIDEYSYSSKYAACMPAAPYKVTARTSSGRGVYSFCMCPGGYVVNASSEQGLLAVNGMSYSDRGSSNANSAIIVQVSKEDFGGGGALAGVEFQRRLEKLAYSIGNGRIPVQYYGDYVQNKKSEENPAYNRPCIKGGYQFSNLRGLLPRQCEEAFLEGMLHFDKIINGFAAKDAILSGIESRTSSPVRILRDENMQSPKLKGLYPCGEGAGYAGGIMSAAMDGILVAEHVACHILDMQGI